MGFSYQDGVALYCCSAVSQEIRETHPIDKVEPPAVVKWLWLRIIVTLEFSIWFELPTILLQFQIIIHLTFFLTSSPTTRLIKKIYTNIIKFKLLLKNFFINKKVTIKDVIFCIIFYISERSNLSLKNQTKYNWNKVSHKYVDMMHMCAVDKSRVNCMTGPSTFFGYHSGSWTCKLQI
jgi:hypothetical protein